MTEDEIRNEKKRLREILKRRLALLTEAEISAKSLRVAEFLTGSEAWKRADWVFCFLFMKREFKTHSVIRQALSNGKRVAAPRIRGQFIDFREIGGKETEWELHPFGIPEPPSAFPVVDPLLTGEASILVVTPGLGFSVNGARLGQGGGFYDRFFEYASAARITAWGVAFECQIIEGIPVTEKDKVMDAVVWERGIMSPELQADNLFADTRS